MPMPELTRSAFWRDRTTRLIVVLAGLGTVHILVRTATYGAAVGTDSTTFLSVAMNFLAGEGWQSFGGNPLVGWPPLFPLLLAACGWIGIEPLEAGRWINAIAFGLTILVAGCWLRSHLRSQWLVLAATVVLMVSLPLSHFASSFLTEPLFFLFTLLALIKLAAFLQHGGRTPLLLSAVFTALAALTRYAGVVQIGAGVLILLPLARLRHTLVFGAVSSLPLLAILAHNWAVAGTLTGKRKGSGQPLSEGLSQTVNIFREWAIPPNVPDGLADYFLWITTGLGAPDWFGSFLWVVTGLVVVATGAVVVGFGRGLGMGENRTAPAHSHSSLGPALLFGVFALIYIIFLVVVLPFVIPVGIYSRYLLPVYAPLLLAATFLLDRFLCIKVAGWVAAAKWSLASFILLGALAHIGLSAHRNLGLTAQARVAGYEQDWTYNVAAWQHSAILNYVRTNLRDGRTYSNNPFLVWFADRTAAIKKHWALPSELRDWTQYARWWTERGEDQAYIVWIKDDYRSIYYDYNDLDLRFLPGVEVATEASDGVVFRVTAAAAAEPFDEAKHRAQKEHHQERYVQQLVEQAGERVARSGWDVYRNGRKLTYVKKPCAPADVQAKFVLHVVPADPADLSISRQRHGFDNLGFHFDRRGFRLDDQSITTIRAGDQCIAIVQLPAYAIGRIQTGQWISADNRTLWEAKFSPSR